MPASGSQSDTQGAELSPLVTMPSGQYTSHPLGVRPRKATPWNKPALRGIPSIPGYSHPKCATQVRCHVCFLWGFLRE